MDPLTTSLNPMHQWHVFTVFCLCQMHLLTSRISNIVRKQHCARYERDVKPKLKKMFLVFFSFALCEWNMPLKHLPCFSSKKIQLNIPLYPYTSQFHSWKQCFMIIKFRCAVWLHAFERPTACDLMLQTFGWVKGNMVSHKMLINVDGAYNKDLGIRNLNMFPGLNMADVLLQKKHI